ncbi:alpha-L-rhamnosidase [Xylaria cf. heliscus]|nr:alpha-L-rhamnosidase [Xylaria cf. heliscus]
MKFKFALLYGQWNLFAYVVAQVPFSEYILAPSSRVVGPVSIYEIGGNVENAAALLTTSAPTSYNYSSTKFVGSGSYITLDFGKNIAGRVSFQVDAVSGSNESIGFTFTESSAYISAELCDAVQDGAFDLPQWFNNTSPGYYKAGHEFQRGAFRYLTVVHNSTGTISLSNITVYWTTSPEMENPAAYTGYFHSNSDKLNRVWYAGAYTNQICSVDPTTGVALGAPFAGWYYNYTISNGTSVLVDGGKRDRVVWPGDIVISGPSIFVSTNSLEPIRNALDSLFMYQEIDGRLPAAGYPLAQLFAWSFTYHCHTLNDVYDYFMFTGDRDYLASIWDRYKLAIHYPLQFIDSTGLANVTSSSDWGRGGMGGRNIEANSILSYTLQNALKLSAVMNDIAETSNWGTIVAGISKAANNLLWDESVFMYRDNDTIASGSSVNSYPQDGNAWAIIAGIANSTRSEAISDALKGRWVRPYGAPAVEAGETISPFASGFELQAHYIAGHSEYAVDLMEFMWADYMLDDPQMTNSTLIEGFATNGSALYPVYEYDPRVSHAHGWSTAPTSILTFLASGLTLTSAAGQTWKVSPALGGLKTIQAGYETPLGKFATSWTDDIWGFSGTFVTPDLTSGTLVIPLVAGSRTMVLKGPMGSRHIELAGLSTVTISDIPGGNYSIIVV